MVRGIDEKDILKDRFARHFEGSCLRGSEEQVAVSWMKIEDWAKERGVFIPKTAAVQLKMAQASWPTH